MRYLVALAGVAALAPAAVADEPRYSLADLKALIAQRSYREAVWHLSDIAPRERTADWLGVAVDAASGYLGEPGGDDLATRVRGIEAIDARYPQLLTAPKYTKVRAEIGIRGYEACFAQSDALDACIERATRFLDADARNTDLAFKMAKALRRSSNPDVAVTFFKRAVAGTGSGSAGASASAAMCKDDALQSAVLAGLGLPKDHDRASDARAIASGPCFDQLKQEIGKALDAEVPGGHVHVNACAFMKAKRALDATQQRSCDKKKS